ncbi:MAG: biopolymer transporter ExbD [Gammaproteobacteria bacterium]|nr:MAG: biopolymer transporter ExbD [Gammaproteobacteria bacterium]
MLGEIAKRNRDEAAELDMTPLLDVVFIMLIFFIVTASFVKEAGLDVSAEEGVTSNEPADPEKRNITVRIEASGRVWVNETPATLDGVQAAIKRLYAQNPQAKVFIRPDPKARTEWLLRVLDQANAAGVPASLVAPE